MAQQELNTQVLVVGGTTGGIAAGIQSARGGVQTIIVEETNMLGGMITAAGVSCADGNNNLKSGMWQEFREALYKHYGTTNLASGWVSNNCFEPHVGDSIFKSWVSKEDQLTVLYGWYLDKVLTKGNTIKGARFISKSGKTLNIKAVVTIDATELGDVYAFAGAAYDVGMESPSYSDEDEAIAKNNIIQDITWAAVLKDYGKGVDKTITRPTGYNPSKYFCSTIDAPCKEKPYPFNTQKVLDYGKLPSRDTLHAKYMLNWPINGNDFYINAVERKPIKRDTIYKAAKNKTLGFIYFLQHELGYKNIGLANDEMDSGMALIPYNREGRRLKGVVRLNINHIKEPYSYRLYKTGIAVGDYPVDHHHAAYPGKVPDIQFPTVPAFNIPLGALIPEKKNGLIVCEKGISVSNIANGCTRLQPVVLLTGQAAGIAAVQCIQKNIQPRAINVKDLQNELLKNNCYLMPFSDIAPGDAAWKAVQRVGAMGIIKGLGKSEDWENKMYFFPDSLMRWAALEITLSQIFSDEVIINGAKEFVTLNTLIETINRYNTEFIDRADAYKNKTHTQLSSEILQQDSSLKLRDYDSPLTRKEVCVFLEKYLLVIDHSGCDFGGVISF